MASVLLEVPGMLGRGQALMLPHYKVVDSGKLVAVEVAGASARLVVQ